MTGSRLPSRESLGKAAECLRTLGHATRLEMLLRLDAGNFNVGQLAESCGVSSHLASEHLRLMERCGLLVRTRVGKETFYRIAEPGLRDVLHSIVNQTGQAKPG